MLREIEKYKIEDFSGRYKRHFEEWRLLEEMYQNSDYISGFTIRSRHPETKLPEKYEITFNVESIIGIDPPVDPSHPNEPEKENLILGSKHKLTIELPPNYPDGYPIFKFITPVWHPQIVFHGKQKGDIDIDIELKNPSKTPLTDYISTIWQYLDYQICLPLIEYPFPEDIIVAEWIRERTKYHPWLLAKAIKYGWIKYIEESEINRYKINKS